MSNVQTVSAGKYFQNLYRGIFTTFKGMWITFKYVWSVKPVTIEYPEVREVLPEGSRGKLYNDVRNCIACEQCATACPVDCIYIASNNRGKEAPDLKTEDGKTAIKKDLTQFTIDTSLCCYCGLCTTVCPTECLTHTKDHEFSQYTLDQFKVEYIAEDVKAWRDRIVK